MLQQIENPEQKEALEQTVRQMQADQEKVREAAASYENAAVTASASVGPTGANMNGWITYTRGGEKIYFELTGKPSYHGLFGGGGGAPLIGTLPSGRLAGTTGTFLVEPTFGGANLYIWDASGQPVFTSPIFLAGGGIGFRIEGKVSFTLHH